MEFIILNFFFLFYYFLMTDTRVGGGDVASKIVLKKYLLKLSSELPIAIVVFVVTNVIYFLYFRKKLLRKIHENSKERIR